MKYLVITNHSYMLWQFRRELISELLRRGEVVVSTPFVGREKELSGLGCRLIETPVDRRGINPAKDLALLGKYRRIIKAEKPDAVITYSIKPNIYGGLAAAAAGVPYYVNVQGLGSAFSRKALIPLVTEMYRLALRKAKTVFFENSGNLDRFVTKKVVSPDKAVLLPGAGVDTEYYSYCAYPSEKDGIHFLFVGRIMKEKGVNELFSAAEKLKSEFGDRISFEVAGFFEDSYSERVKKLSDNGVITYLGFLQDVRPLYESCHCVVLPSYHEGMSNVLLEGASTGRPLITTDIPGCREAVIDGVSGFVCRPADADSLYRSMKRFAEMTEEERLAMGKAGREHMLDFGKHVVVRKTMEAVDCGTAYKNFAGRH